MLAESVSSCRVLVVCLPACAQSIGIRDADEDTAGGHAVPPDALYLAILYIHPSELTSCLYPFLVTWK